MKMRISCNLLRLPLLAFLNLLAPGLPVQPKAVSLSNVVKHIEGEATFITLKALRMKWTKEITYPGASVNSGYVQ